MPIRSVGQHPITPYSEPERFIHQTLRKKKKRNQFIPVEDRVLKTKYPPFENRFEAEVVYNPFLDLPFPMADDQPMWGNNRAVAPTLGAAIVAVDLRDNFIVKGYHFSMIKDRQFDGRSRDDPHKHIVEFIKVCGMFRYGNTNADAIKLKLFPSSLAGEAKIWFNELRPGVITTWEEIKQAFVSRFFSPAMFDRLIGEIQDEPTQAILDAGGIFLYKTPNEVHQLLEDRVLLKLDWSKENKTQPLRKTVAFAKSEDHSPLLEKMEALTTRIDSQFKEIRGDMKEMRDGCNKCGGPHPSSDCDDKPIGGPKEEKQDCSVAGYSRGIEEIIMVEILAIGAIVMKTKTQPLFYNLKRKVKQGQKNHQAAIQDLETKFGRISNHQSSRPTGTLPSNTQTNPKSSTSNKKPYRPPPTRNEHVNAVFTRSGKTYKPPANPNTKTVVFLDDSEDEAEEVEKEVEPLPKKPTQTDTPPLKAYKPKIPYP
ncbi:reverse transcriptase domain-containing protein [Tanacetum coccineum]|uniref:Reverse transcriptase domain-containing protein n=1 Tax=Tanacetum coccineum TaxID=301880 RepID=A0ABQ4WCN1_9ASTR